MEYYQEDGLQRIRSANEIVIFGTGYVAESFWYGLERLNLTSKVSFFAVSDTMGRDVTFHERPVYSLSNIVWNKNMLVCLAVHSAIAEELERTLNSIVPDQVIWIYPLLYDLIYGKPVEQGVPILRSELVRMQNSSFNWISVRYMAARDYLRHSADYELSRSIYIQAMSAHCRASTAAERLHNLEKLADSMAKRGFDAGCPVLIDSNWRIIDGLHRVAVACVLKIETLPCNIVPVSEAYDVLLSDRNKLPEYVLVKVGLSSEQLVRLAEAKQDLIMSFY